MKSYDFFTFPNACFFFYCVNFSDEPSSDSDGIEPLSESSDEETTEEAEDEMLLQPPPSSTAADGLQHGPYLKLSRGEETNNYLEELNVINERKFMCSVDLFLDLFQKRCLVQGCNNVPKVNHHFVGTTLVVRTTCDAGHQYSFASSHEVNGMYVNNLQSAAAILLSGNNFSKVSRMADFLNLSFLSESTYRMQRLYLVPAVEEWWCWMREELVAEFVGQKIVVGGDGQCDSPGFTAKNLCYFLMEITTNYILEIEVRDKRHVGLSSTNMEKEALRNALTRLKEVLDVVEIATDASSSIKKLIGK